MQKEKAELQRKLHEFLIDYKFNKESAKLTLETNIQNTADLLVTKEEDIDEAIDTLFQSQNK